MNTAELANWAEILGFVALLVGGAFAVLEIRRSQRQRREIAAVELVRVVQSEQVASAFRLGLDVPVGASVAEVNALGDEHAQAVITICNTYENLGLLVFRGVVPYDLVRDLTGNVCVHYWNRLRSWTEELRRDVGEPAIFEWCQWLSERLASDPKLVKVAPAYELHRDWPLPR